MACAELGKVEALGWAVLAEMLSACASAPPTPSPARGAAEPVSHPFPPCPSLSPTISSSSSSSASSAISSSSSSTSSSLTVPASSAPSNLSLSSSPTSSLSHTTSSASSSTTSSTSSSTSASAAATMIDPLPLAKKVILIDVRPISDYSVGHIPGAFCLRLSSILLRRFTQGKLTLADLVVEEQRDLFLARAPSCHLVIYDDTCASLEPFDPKCTLHAVLAAAVKSFPEVAFLKGGYSAFKACKSDDVAVGVLAGGDNLCLLLPPAAGADLEHGSEKAFVDRAPSCILPHLYVGSQAHAQNRELLRSVGVTHVVNITATCPNKFEGELAYLSIPIKDTWNQCISSHFPAAFDFIDSAKEKGGVVLLHCVAGISRSPTFAIAYLMYRSHATLEAAINLVKSQRTIIAPNLDFMVELQLLEKTLRNTSLKDVDLARSLSQDSEGSELFSSSSGEAKGEDSDASLSPSSRAISLCASLNRDSFSALLDTRS